MLKSNRLGVCVAMVLMALTAGTARGQALLYTFDSGWPAEIQGWEMHEAPDYATAVFNNRDATLHIGTGYTGFEDSLLFGTPGNAAMWGTQLDGWVDFDFYGLGTARYVSFDFAWLLHDDNIRDSIYIELLHYETPLNLQSFELTDWFDGGFAGGKEGRIVINAGDFGYDEGLTGIRIHVNAPYGNSNGNFVIDNFYASHQLPSLPDENNTSQLKMTFNGGSGELTDWVGFTVLQDSGDYIFADEVTNIGGDATTYTLTYTGDIHAPTWQSVINQPIDAYETLQPGSLVAIAPTDQTSGLYEGVLTLHNDINPNDPDKSLTLQYQVYAPAIVTANTSEVITPTGADTISIANADVEGHDGALRASLQVVAQSLEGSGFYLADGDLDINDLILPGEAATATVGFDPYGKIAGEYEGTLALDLKMVAAHWMGFEGQAIGLNRAPAAATYTWQLHQVVSKTTHLELTVDPGTNLGQAGIGLADDQTAMTLLDGHLAETHSVVAQFTTNPSPTTAEILGSVVELTLGEIADYYVLQLTYRDDDVPASISELDLRLNVYDPETGAWVHAILLNSDGGAGGIFFEGSYDAYLASIGSIPVLGAHGVDVDLNHVWAVLDHNSIFGIAVPEPASLVLMSLGGAMLLTRRR